MIRRFDRRWTSISFLLMAMFIIAIDETVLDLALPSISRSLGASTEELQWAINAYVLAYAGPLLVIGALADGIGRKRMFLIGTALFGVTSFAATLASNMPMLIACRGVQGLAGAMLLPSTLSILRATFRDPKERIAAVGVWSGVYELGAMLGPVVGGVLLEYASWQAVFYINVPIAGIALVGAAFTAEESRDGRAGGADTPGMVLALGGAFCLVYAITASGAAGVSTDVVAVAVASVTFLCGFILWEKRTDHPMIPPSLFSNRPLTGAIVAMTVTMFGLAGALFFLSQYLQSVLGLTPLQAGMLFLPFGVLSAAGAVVSPRVVARLGVSLTIVVGLVAAAIGMIAMSPALESGDGRFLLPGGLLTVVGLGITFTPAADTVLGALPVSRAGVGSALDQTMQMLGAALGVALLGSVANGLYRAGVGPAGVPGLGDATLDQIRGSIQGAHVVAERLQPAAARAVIEAANGSFSHAMSVSLVVGGVFLLFAAVCAWRLIPQVLADAPVELEPASGQSPPNGE